MWMEKGDSKALREKRLELCMGHLTAKVPERVIKKKKKKRHGGVQYAGLYQNARIPVLSVIKPLSIKQILNKLYWYKL